MRKLYFFVDTGIPQKQMAPCMHSYEITEPVD